MTQIEIDQVIQSARRTQAEQSQAVLKAEIDTKQAEINALNKRRDALAAQIDSHGSDVDKSRLKLADLDAVREFIAADKLSEARESVVQAMNGAEARKDSVQFELAELQSQIVREVRALDAKRDKFKLLTDPFHRPKYPNRHDIVSFLTDSRPEISAGYDKVRALLSTAPTDDVVAVAYQIKALGAWLRQMQDKLAPLSGSEEVAMRRIFGSLSMLAKDMSCGYIDSLNPRFKTDWHQFASEARGQLAMRRNVLAGRSAPATPNEPNEEVAPDPEESELMVEIIESGICRRTAGLRLAVIGGSETRNKVAVDWIADALQLGKIAWHDAWDASMGQSIKSGGVNLLLMFTSWIGHKSSRPSDAECKSRNIPVAYANSSSKRAIFHAIRNAIGA